MRNKFLTIMAIAPVLCTSCGSGTGESTEIISKQTIEVSDGQYTPEIMHMLGKVSDPQLSPDGTRILYGVSYTSIEQNKSNRELFIMNADGSENHRITNSAESESNARWIENGEKIAFLRGGQIWVMDADGSNARQVSDVKKGIDAFEFAPSGDKLIYMSNVKSATKPSDLYPDLDKSDARIITGLMYRHWDHFVEEIPHTFVAPFDGSSVGEGRDILDGEPYELPTLPFGGLEQLAWSPDSEYIAYSCRKLTGKEYAFSTNTDIYLYDIQTGSSINLTEGMMGYDTNPLFSPDGRYLAWLSMERAGYEADKNRLFIMDLQSRQMRELSADYKYNVESITWAPESDKIYFTSCINAVEAILEVDIDKDCTLKYKPAKGEKTSDIHLGNGVRRITAENVMSDFSPVQVMAGRGKLLATYTSMLHPAEIVTVDIADGAVTQLSFENSETLEKLEAPTMEERWITTVDGKLMHEWVLYPPEFDKSKKYPAILICLGGPQGTASQGWSTRWNYRLIASQGYIVVIPNRRGTSAFGQQWCEQISGDYIGLNMQDYLKAADEIRKEPYVGKIAAAGASYGGYSIYNLAGIHEGRFSAFLAHAGIFNQEHMYMTTEEMWFPTWDNGGAPWDRNPVAERHYKNSPHKLIRNWDTPILITHGELDYRVPVEQGMAAFNAAQMMGVPSEMLLFPDENHWINKPQNSILWNRYFFNWIEKYCR